MLNFVKKSRLNFEFRVVYKILRFTFYVFVFLSHANIMPRKYARSNRKVSRTKGTHKRTNRFRRSGFRVLSRRISAVSKRVAGEVCKFESTPELFKHALLSFETSSSYTVSFEQPLLNITSGNPWVMPLNWVYQQPYNSSGSISTPPFYNGSVQGLPVSGSPVYTSLKQPIWYNALFENENNPATPNSSVASSTDYQYRLKYMYINALFNASVQSSQNNTDGALRIVIVKDKQPTGGAATWFDSNITANSRGVFQQSFDARVQQEKRESEERKQELARIRPEFEAFAAKFPTGSDHPLNFGRWSNLHKKGLAPTADDVPSDNTLNIVDFMNHFKAKHENSRPVPFPIFSRNIPDYSRNFPICGTLFTPPQRAVA